MKRNTANKLTAVRVISIPLIMFCLLSGYEVGALVVFVLATITDIVDGYIARKQDQVSSFGKFADPIADKLLVSAIFVTFIQLGELTAVPVTIILAREFLVTGFRLIGMSKEEIISASLWGKMKTVSQITLIIIIIVMRGWGFWLAELLKPWAVYVAVALTLVSGINYFFENRKILEGSF